MKKIFILLSLLISSVFVFAQGPPFPNYQRQGSAQTRWEQAGAVQSTMGFINGVFADTIIANAVSNIDFYKGAQIFTTLDSTLWIRNSTATRWMKANTGPGSITTFNFITDSSIRICFGDNTCDTLSIINFTQTVNNIVQNFNDSTIYHLNDSTLIICNAAGSCDTIDLGTTNTYFFLSPDSLVTCDTIQVICPIPDSCYQQQLCDTIVLGEPVISTVYQNFLHKAGNIVEVGSPSFGGFGGIADGLHDTYLSSRFPIYMNSAAFNNPPFNIKQYNWVTENPSIIGFNHYGKYPPTTLLDGDNPVNLYLNYTNPFSDDTTGFMHNRYGYMWMTNSRGARYSYLIDDMAAKQVGIFFDTYSPNNEGVTIFAQQVPSTYNFASNPSLDSTLLDKRVAVFKTNQDLQLPNYPSTRNDGGTAIALYTDIDGNVKLGPVNGGDIITIINDTTINICSFGTNLCDTFIVNNIGVLQTVTIINDSTLLVCDSVGICDTLHIPQTVMSQPITANNGLIMSTPTNVQLGAPFIGGAPLLHNTFISSSVNTWRLNIDGVTTGVDGGMLDVITTGSGGIAIKGTTLTGRGIYGIANGNGGVGVYGLDNGASIIGIGVVAASTAGAGIWARSFNYVAGQFTGQPASTTTATTVLEIIRASSGGAGGNGIGGSIDFRTRTSSLLEMLSHSIVSRWTDANHTTRSSQYILRNVNNAVTADVHTVHATGQHQLNKYGIGTFTGTATFLIAEDANGNLIEYPTGGLPGGGNLITADEGLTTSSPTNVRLFGPVGTPATLTTDRYLTAGSNTLNITFNSLAGASGLNLTSTSTAASGNLQRGLNVSLSGTNSNSTQSTYAGYFTNTHGGTNSLNYGIQSTVSGGAALNVAIRADATGTSSIGVIGSGANWGGQFSSAGIAVEGINTGGGYGAYFGTHNSASTNTTIPFMLVTRNTTGTAANGLGVHTVYQLESSDGSMLEAAQFRILWANATTATPVGQIDLNVNDGGTSNTTFSVIGNGSVKLRPITATAASAITPAEGLLVFVSNTDATFTSIGIWCYQNGAWKAL